MIKGEIINNSSANTKSKIENALYPALFGLGDEQKNISHD
jgi:hypothetical protein